MKFQDSPNGLVFLIPKTTKDREFLDYLKHNDFLDRPKLSELTGQPYAVNSKNIKKVLALYEEEK